MSLTCSGQVTSKASSGGYTAQCSEPWIQGQDFFTALTYAESGQLLGATALIFSLAFIFRSVLKNLGF